MSNLIRCYFIALIIVSCLFGTPQAQYKLLYNIHVHALYTLVMFFLNVVYEKCDSRSIHILLKFKLI